MSQARYLLAFLDAAGGVGALNPGLSGSVTLDLAAGNYVTVGFVPNA